MPRLILIDGFAGTGKSTTAQRLWLDLTRRGISATWLHEHETGHPIVQYGDVEDLLLHTPDQFESRMLEGWQRVARSIARAPGAYIVEGAFVQIPVGVMTAMNLPAARIRRLLRRMDAVLAGGGTSLVYLYRRDLQAALRQIGVIRGPQWLEVMTAAVGRSPYGQRHRVRGLNGLAAFYERQRAVVASVLPALTIRHTAIEVPGRRFDRVERRLTSFLGMARAAEPAIPRAVLLRHIGTFTSASGAPAVVTTDGAGLFLAVPATQALPLLRVRDGHFCAKSLPIDIRFTYDRQGRARRFTYRSRMSNEVLTDTSWIRT